MWRRSWISRHPREGKGGGWWRLDPRGLGRRRRKIEKRSERWTGDEGDDGPRWCEGLEQSVYGRREDDDQEVWISYSVRGPCH